MQPLTLALPTGRPLGAIAQLLREAGYELALEEASRRLVLADPANDLTYILAKPVDVPTYVAYGAADLGIAGKDVLWEREPGTVAELLDLGLSRCQLVVAVPARSGLRDVGDLPPGARVATKYPRITARYFRELGVQVEVVPLGGSIELAPIVGLAEAIVDITETGRTLRENGLVPVATVGTSTLRLVANHVRYRAAFGAIQTLLRRLREVSRPPRGEA